MEYIKGAMHLLFHGIPLHLNIYLVDLEPLLPLQLRQHINYSILYEMQWLYVDEKLLFKNYSMTEYFHSPILLGTLQILLGKLRHLHLQRQLRSLSHSIIKYGHIKEVHFFILDDFLEIHSSLISLPLLL